MYTAFHIFIHGRMKRILGSSERKFIRILFHDCVALLVSGKLKEQIGHFHFSALQCQQDQNKHLEKHISKRESSIPIT